MKLEICDVLWYVLRCCFCLEWNVHHRKNSNIEFWFHWKSILQDEQGLGGGEMANLLQPDLLQAYVQLLAQQPEGSVPTPGGEAEPNYSSTSLTQSLAANSSLLQQVVPNTHLVL